MCMNEYATLSPHQNNISRSVGGSVFFPNNGERLYVYVKWG